VTSCQLYPQVLEWLEARGVSPVGPSFFKYNLVEMERALEVEVGVPIAEIVAGDGRVLAAVLPGGRYARLSHTGPPTGLGDATAGLLDWAAGQGLSWDVTEKADGPRWAARLEIYEFDPRHDMDHWRTELAFRLADQ
jgi:effector-binding domain-containing protein